MRISTTAFYDTATARMATLNARADTLQTQIATGTRLTAASQDAAAWTRLSTLKRDEADASAFAANVKLAQGLLTQTDGALGSVETQLQRARELAIQAGSGTLDAPAREAIAVQLDGLVADLVALANTTDARGQPLFGASSGEVPFVTASDGTVSVAGSGGPATIPVANGVVIEATVLGAQVFGGAGAPAGTTDVFATLQGLAAALRSGEDASAASGAALAGITAGEAQVTGARASAGARAMRLELEASRASAAGVDRAEAISGLEETDTAAAITELQKTLTVLQATQASFAKLSGLSLFDYLR